MSRLVLAPRLGLASLARQAVAPAPGILRHRVAFAALPTKSLLARAYSQNNSNSNSSSSSSNSNNNDNNDKAKTQGNDDAAAPSEPPTKDTPESESKPDQIPFHELPNLTQGIPSTLAQEMAQRAAGKQKVSSPSSSSSSIQKMDQEDPEQELLRRRRDRFYDSYESSQQERRRKNLRFVLAFAAAAAVVGIIYLGREWEDAKEAGLHPDAPDGWTPGAWWARLRARAADSVAYYQSPPFERLLPDPQPYFARRYTLCLSLEDLLVHSEWSRQHGWRVAKRPGVDYFLLYLSQYYELVIFTKAPLAEADLVLQKLDPHHIVMWRLFREATKFEDGEIVKDLSYLNRDLSKVIMIDTDPGMVRKQPENAIVLPPWDGSPSDGGLVALIPFLEYIHTMEYDDVRRVLRSFRSTSSSSSSSSNNSNKNNDSDIPREFARREAAMRREFQKKRQGGAGGGAGIGAAVASVLGLTSSNMSLTVQPEGEQTPSEAFAQGKMLQDIARERGQRNYELMAQNIRDNGEQWLKEEREMMEKLQKEAMNDFVGWFGKPRSWFGGGGGNEDNKSAEDAVKDTKDSKDGKK